MGIRLAWHLSLLGGAIVASGCALLGGQTGQEDSADGNPLAGNGCQEVLQAAAPAEQTPLGFAPEQVHERLAGTHTATLSWYRAQSRTELSLEVGALVSASFVEANGPGVCPERVELEVGVRVTSADGALDVETLARVWTSDLERLELLGELPTDAVAVPAVLADLDLAQWSDPRLSLRARWEGGAFSGEFTLDGADPDPHDSQAPVSAWIGEFPAP